MSVLTIPYAIDDGHFNILVVLSETNIARIKQHDPCELATIELHEACGERFKNLRLRDVILTYVEPSEVDEVMRLAYEGKLVELAKMVMRGYTYRPGDNFEPVRI